MTAVTASIARRELRGGIKGFRVLVACLALGVAAIAAAGSLRAAFDRAINEDSRSLLGGDLAFRQSYQAISPDQRQTLAGMGRVSEGIEMRAMARSTDGNSHRLVELKGVDGTYPLVGQLQLSPSLSPDQALGKRDGIWGAAVDPHLLANLGVGVGGKIAVGDAWFEIRSVINKEPDRVANALAFGPRLMVASEAIAETGLIQPGSVIRHYAYLALDSSVAADKAKRVLAERFPNAGWHMRDVSDAAPGVGRFLDNMAAFLTLVGLTALLTGGIGIANAVKAYLDGRTGTIAILKAVGAPSRLIFSTYGLLVGLMSVLGIAIGLGVGAAIPWAVVEIAGDKLPLAARVGLYPAPLAVAAGFGVLTALVFALWPLTQAGEVPATALFRHLVSPVTARPSLAVLACIGLAGAALAGLAIASAERPGLAAAFVASAVATLALFRALAWALSSAAKRLGKRRAGWAANPVARLALANLHRPGTTVVSMVASLGLGLTVLVAIAQVEGNLARQFGETLPKMAPSFFFIDITPEQKDTFPEIVRSVAPGAEVEMASLVRGRVIRLNGKPVDENSVSPEAQWAVKGDRGLTTAETMPPGTRLLEGQWWRPDYQGPALASIDAKIAKGLGLKLGDTVTLNVLGRDLELTIASLRDIDWGSFNMNFTFVLSPGALAGAPVSWIATVHAEPEREVAIEKAVVDRLGNVSAIRVKEALESIRDMIANADLAVRLAALVTLASGGLVLSGAVMAGHRRRVAEAVVLKVLGATRGDLFRAWLLEFGIVGASTGIAAGVIGSLSAYAILTRVMRADWVFLPGVSVATLAICIAASLLAGFGGIFTAMRAKTAPLLREE